MLSLYKRHTEQLFLIKQMCNEFEIRNKCTNDEYYVVL